MHSTGTAPWIAPDLLAAAVSSTNGAQRARAMRGKGKVGSGIVTEWLTLKEGLAAAGLRIALVRVSVVGVVSRAVSREANPGCAN
jgi:hypothetical protein